MTAPIKSEQLSRIRDAARVVLDRTANQEHGLDALVASANLDLRGAEAALQLCADAHEQHVAAGLLLARLDRSVGTPRGERGGRGDGVLVVDDHGSIRDGIAEILREAGFVVRTAANGLEGLLAAHEMQPGVIVMDINMPVLDGLEATRLIKASPVTRQARVIAYTGNLVLPHDAATPMFAGVIQKPATPAVVLAAVRHAAGL